MDFDEKTLILGIGAQKTGTTWLHSYLIRRPDVFMSPQKEMHYFDIKYRPELCGDVEKRLNRKFKKLNRRRQSLASRQKKRLRSIRKRLNFNGNDAAYKDYFRSAVPDKFNFYGEITPSYALVTEEGFRSIRQLFPHIRLVFIMRDPIERFYSQIRHASGEESEHSHEELIRQHLHDPRYIERSSYENPIRNIEANFDKSEIAYLFFETMFNEEAILGLCGRIGIEYLPPKFERVVNSSGPRQEISQELYDELKKIFEPTYAFCRQRFGDQLPKSWGVRSKTIAEPAIVEPLEN